MFQGEWSLNSIGLESTFRVSLFLLGFSESLLDREHLAWSILTDLVLHTHGLEILLWDKMVLASFPGLEFRLEKAVYSHVAPQSSCGTPPTGAPGSAYSRLCQFSLHPFNLSCIMYDNDTSNKWDFRSAAAKQQRQPWLSLCPLCFLSFFPIFYVTQLDSTPESGGYLPKGAWSI